jgi:Flp pilus assembly protein TadG
MKNSQESFFRSIRKDQRGQSAVWVALSLTAMLGLSGLSVDVGHAYIVRSQVQTAVNASALSGASSAGLYSTGSASAKSVATHYAGLNSVSGAGAPTVTTPCINLLMEGGTGCTNDSSGNANGNSSANAVRVTETAVVPMYFMRVLGFSSLTIKATALAADSSTQPWNVAIILDATGSMGTNDPYCTTRNTTAEQCAMNGIQTMLKGINPCYGSTTCSATDANSVFRVSLFSFPNVPVSTVADDYNCSGTPTAAVYTLPVIPTTSTTDGYAPFFYTKGVSGGTTLPAETYQITPHSADTTNIDANGFSSDYYSAGSLNSSSILVKAVGNGSTKGCMKPPSTTGWPDGLYMTYFAGAIYAAQTALQAEQTAVTKLGLQSKNAIIFVSDGQANMPYDGFPQNKSTASDITDGYSVTSIGSSTTNLRGTANSFGIYPDYHDDCQQAIAAAQTARSMGTRFYAVAYGSESSGCVTDSTSIASTMPLTLNVSYTTASQVKPCMVMENMASPMSSIDGMWYFYTDGSSVANGCSDTKHTSTNMQSIFGAIAATFKNARLIPNTAT